MAHESLSQAELDALLRVDVANPRAQSAADYNFGDPEHRWRPRLRAIQTQHEALARRLADSLSPLLRTTVDIKLASVHRATCGQFLARLDCPTCLCIVRTAPLDEQLAIDISLAIMFPMIDRMLGGGRAGASMVQRPLTDIEQRLAMRVNGLLLDELRRAWPSALGDELKVDRIESDPRAVLFGPLNEQAAVCCFEVMLGDCHGSITLCASSAVVERWTAPRAQAWTGATEGFGDALLQSPVELVARLTDTKIGTGELLNLREGDIITTDHEVSAGLSVCVQGVPKFRAHAGAVQGQKAIRIDASLPSSEHRAVEG
jgi:flagellar motor switch protein FliM